METSEKNTRVHLGRKITRIRELRGMKQETLAFELGVSQQTISNLSRSAEIEESTLEKVASVLGLSVESLKISVKRRYSILSAIPLQIMTMVRCLIITHLLILWINSWSWLKKIKIFMGDY